ncbi:hypothetical protein CR513_61345, partial [Mucuna pruriens]
MFTYQKYEGLEIIKNFLDAKIANALCLDTFIYWLEDLSLGSLPLKVYYDNNSIVFYSNNNRSSTKSNFIDIKYLVVKEMVQEKHIYIEHIETNSILVDPHIGVAFEIILV